MVRLFHNCYGLTTIVLEDYKNAEPICMYGNAGVKATSDLTIMVNFSGRVMHATEMAVRATPFP